MLLPSSRTIHRRTGWTALAVAILATWTVPGAAQAVRTSEVRVQTDAGTIVTATTRDVAVRRSTLSISRDQTWQALVSAWRALGLQVTAVDEAGGTLMVSRQRLPRRLAGEPLSAYFDCGSSVLGPLVNQATVFVDVTAHVHATPAGTVVETRVTAFGRERTSSTQTVCTTTGVLEARLEEELVRHIQG